MPKKRLKLKGHVYFCTNIKIHISKQINWSFLLYSFIFQSNVRKEHEYFYVNNLDLH